ncbi:MAG: cupin domain-containing protein [Crocinitomicaceae bacterium]|nr:cupin domain-containing protein [Crocinitomicaceae bacterium]
MKQIIFFILILIVKNSYSQLFRNQKTADAIDKNISVQKISEDELHSTYMIIVKNKVPLHYHKDHSENLVVLEGRALMKIGNDTLKIIPKDQVTIPKGTIHEIIKVIGKIPLKVISVQSPKFDPKDRYFIKKEDQ